MVETMTKDGEAGSRAAWSVSEMDAAARESEGRECYREIESGKDCRVGIVASALPSGCVLFSIEVCLRLCRREGEVRPQSLEQAALLSRRLQERGYTMSHLDDGWIVCEKPLFKEVIATEVDYLAEAIHAARGAFEKARSEGAAASSRRE